MGLVGLVKQGLLGDGTKLELLETNNGLKVVSEQFEEFCKLQDNQQPTLALSYLVRDGEESGIVAPKGTTGGKHFFGSTERNTPGAEEVTVTLVELPKIHMVAGCKIFKRAEGIPRVEEEG
ncbi:hypothetical protein A2U01_0025562, partial [Trifolium medium]|nr:hypothetical protein [Trifolium medium]